MKKLTYWLFFLVLITILVSCLDGHKTTNNGKNKTKKVALKDLKSGRDIINAGSETQYTGSPGKLIVVTENTVYTNEIKNLFDSIFAAPIRPFYPYTPYFEIHERTLNQFNSLSTKLRNIIELTIDNKVEKGKPIMHIFENYYAKTQLYTKIQAHDITDLYQILQEEIGYLFKLYDRQEWKREFYRHRKYANTEVREKIKTKFGIDLTLPDKYKYESIDNTYGIILFPERSKQMDLKTTGNSAVSRVNFIESGVMIWEYPFKDSSQLIPEHLIQMRDSILKKYVKHEIPGVYMGTQYHPAVIPQYEKFKIGDVIGYQIRGLYKFTGKMEPSGGRFWEFQFKHPYRNTIVALSGYVGAPPTVSPSLEINKIRAIIYSMKPVK
ncbi:MAG: DUF4837 family protein [Brumimicrobium sp.]|nr:DUF4837 family protein [Brumimicrobium sp.]